MNERIKLLADRAGYTPLPGFDFANDLQEVFLEKFAELIVQGCADFVRENYDHEAAESIAWCMEINYGLHGDYA